VLGCAAELYQRARNSSLAEQKNRLLRKIETQCAFMKQTTFLTYLRYYLYRLNRLVGEGKFWT